MEGLNRLGVSLALVSLMSGGCGGGRLPSGPSVTNAKSITWDIENQVNTTAFIKFFDRDTGDIWPTATTHWELGAGQRQTYKLACSKGSQICFGASQSNNLNIYWGVALDGRQGCQGCCAVCGNGDPIPIKLQ